jgi:hypothetical protein
MWHFWTGEATAMNSLGTIILLLTTGATAASAGELRAGAAVVDITPLEGTPLAGYYSPRGAKGVLDKLYAKSIVLEQDGIRVALVVCDLISLPRQTVVEARQAIEKRTGIPGAHVMISATHTHTGPAVIRQSALDAVVGATNELGRRYSDNLPALIARSVEAASRKLDAVSLTAAIGKEENLSFNRRFVMRDGTVSWNPRKLDPNILRPAGPIDPDVGILRVERHAAPPLATYVNFAMHPDTVSGADVSADFPGVLAQLLADCQGNDMVTVFANGCCGNLNHRRIGWAEQPSGPRETRRIGTVLAGAVCRTLPMLQAVNSGGLRVTSALVTLPAAQISSEDVSRAKANLERMADPKLPFLDKVKAVQVLDVAAREGKPWDVEVQVIALNDQVAWVSLPGEIFVELGLAIKKASPFRYTFIAELANGSIGYIPDHPAYAQGNYEVVSARCKEGSGELLVETAVRLLKEIQSQPTKK